MDRRTERARKGRGDSVQTIAQANCAQILEALRRFIRDRAVSWEQEQGSGLAFERPPATEKGKIPVPKDAVGEFMQRYLGRAVTELRRRKEWDQAELAQAFNRHGPHPQIQPPDRRTVSQWENGHHRPSPAHQNVLSKIARAQKEAFLHDIFSAPPSAWTLVVAIVQAGILVDPDAPERSQIAGEE